MPETEEINRILGELEQEIQNIRDSELKIFIEPFIKETQKLVTKIEEINFPERLDIIDNKVDKVTESVAISFKEVNSSLKREINNLKESNETSIKSQNVIIYIIGFLVLVSIVLHFIKV